MEGRPQLTPLEATKVAASVGAGKRDLLERIRMRSRNIALGSAAAAAALALSGCGGSDVSEGQIVSKKIEPERTYVIPIPIQTGRICTTSGGKVKITTCTPIYTYIPYIHRDDADWVLKLEDCSQNKCRYGNVYVSEATYLSAKVGERYQKSELDLTDDDIDRRRASRQEREQAGRAADGQTISG